MKDTDLLKAMGKIRPEYIEEAEAPKTGKKKALWPKAARYAALAAGLALAVLLGMNAPKLFGRAVPAETMPAQEGTSALTLPDTSMVFIEVITAAKSLAASTEASSDPAETTLPEESTGTILPAEEIDYLSFYGSIEDFLEAQKQDPGSAGEVFFVPDLPPEEYQLVSVSKRDGVYISLLYKAVDPAVSTEPLSAYDAERRTMLTCTTYLSREGLEMFVKNGFQETVFDEKSYYVWEEHAENDSEKSLNGYEIVFLKDGKRVFMYLPATDSFEKLMRYADPEKRIVGE
ncbi:MAG: hypothetical protein J5496_06060 [Lachnospiraceae bacterium]|nr:hypothetical protein [Lachnospiraceae bacterium]